MKLESDLFTYILYKYLFLFFSIMSIAVFLFIITGNGSEPNGILENVIGLILGVCSLVFFMILRKRFVRVRLDPERFEILNTDKKGVYSWNDLKEIKPFGDIVFKFKRKSDNKFIYSITDQPKKFPIWRSDRKTIWETEIRSLILAKKRELQI